MIERNERKGEGIGEEGKNYNTVIVRG